MTDQKPAMTPNEEFENAPFRQTWRVVLFLLILALCCFTRLWDLGSKTMMHDELLFIYYTYAELYQSWSYIYRPILHGPLMLHLQNMTWHLFGVNDYTTRLGCALLGIAGFFFIWKLRPWLREPGVWIALLFYTLSPGLTFYQRFFRNDALFLFNTLWIITSLAWWWRTKDGRWAVSFLVGCTALFGNKESSVFIYFSVITFLILFLMQDIIAWFFEGKHRKLTTFLDQVPKFPNPVWPALLLGGFVVLSLTFIFEGIRYDADVVRAIGHDWALRDVRSIPLALGWMSLTPEAAPDAGAAIDGSLWRKVYLLLVVGTIALFALIKIAIEKRIGHQERIVEVWRRIYSARWYIIGGLAFCAWFYMAIFTTLFKHKIGFFEIYSRTWAYWGGQHEWGRIGGPFHQHLLNIIIYETPALLLVVGAWLVSLFRFKASRHVGFAIFLIAIPAAAFHFLTFSGMQTLDPTTGEFTRITSPYLKNIILGALFFGSLIILLPRASRMLVPLSFLALVGWSLVYMAGSEWAALRETMIYKDGEPVIKMGRHVPLKDYMEITFNFDYGWNLALVMSLIFIATVQAWNSLVAGKTFRAFLIWWTITSYGAASYAREAVPQIGIHAMLPLILLAASYSNDVWATMKSRRWLVPGAVILGICALYSTKATFNLNFHNHHDPRERMVYGPNSEDIKNHMDFVRAYAGIAPVRMDGNTPLFVREWNSPRRHKDMRIHIQPIDAVGWSAKWYFRDLEYTESNDASRAIRERWEFLFLRPNEIDRHPELAEHYNMARGRGTLFWTPSVISPESLGNIWMEAIPAHYLDNSPQAGKAYNAKQDWWRLWRYFSHREVFDGTGRGFPSISSNSDYVFLWRKDLL